MSKTGPYREAGDLVTQVLTKRRGLKSLVFASSSTGTATATTTMKCSKSTYAVACRTLEHKSRMDDILDADGGHLRKKVLEGCRNVGLAYVLLHELLFSKYGKIRGGGAVKRRIVKYEKELRRGRERLVGAAGDGGDSSDRAGADTARRTRQAFPRYVRVNTLKIDVATAARMLQDTLDADSRGEDADGADRRPRRTVYADPHVPDLLVLPPGTELHDHELASDGRVVLQDKSSCFPALALVRGGRGGGGGGDADDGDADDGDDGFWKRCTSDGCGVDVLDACAAPGNKTTHLAALLDGELQRQGASLGPQEGRNALEKAKAGKRGKKKAKKRSGSDPSPGSTDDDDAGVLSRIFACDRDSKRVGILRRRVEHLVPKTELPLKVSADGVGGGASPRLRPVVEVVPLHADFLRLEHTDPRLSGVRAILLDPSCTGSGIASRPDRGELDGKGDDQDRIDALASFQLVALKHAMGFPRVERIVYSTCSVHDRENEAVVEAALREHNGEVLGDDGGDGDGDTGGDGGGGDTWELVAPACLSLWHRRGRVVSGLDEGQARCMVRCDAAKGDETNGFFVAFLERTKDARGSSRNDCERLQGQKQGHEVCGGFAEKVAKEGESCRLRHGVPVYNGEYADDASHDPGISGRGGDDGTTIGGECSGGSPSRKRKEGCSEEEETAEGRRSDRTDADVHGRKRAKRLKWKLKQKKMKEDRMKRKKAASSGGA